MKIKNLISRKHYFNQSSEIEKASTLNTLCLNLTILVIQFPVNIPAIKSEQGIDRKWQTQNKKKSSIKELKCKPYPRKLQDQAI